MKIQTKIGDLTTLLASTDATTKAAHDAERLTAAIATGCREIAISALDISLASREAATKAAALFAKLPPTRRDLATATKTKAEALGKAAAALGERYSGETDYAVKWAVSPSASTYTSGGDQYSGRCTYRKTDASHVVKLSPEWAVLLAEREDVASLSARDGLPLIGWHADGRVCWAKPKGKAITEEIGYIAHFGTVCYHSTKSQKAADQGLKIKLAARRDEWAAQSRAALLACVCSCFVFFCYCCCRPGVWFLCMRLKYRFNYSPLSRHVGAGGVVRCGRQLDDCVVPFSTAVVGGRCGCCPRRWRSSTKQEQARCMPL